MMGYDDFNPDYYRVYDLTKRAMIRERDISFNEKCFKGGYKPFPYVIDAPELEEFDFSPLHVKQYVDHIDGQPETLQQFESDPFDTSHSDKPEGVNLTDTDTDPMQTELDDDSDDDNEQVSQNEANKTKNLKSEEIEISEGVLDAQGVSPQGVSPQTDIETTKTEVTTEATETEIAVTPDATPIEAEASERPIDGFIPYHESTEVLYEDENARETEQQYLTHTEQETQQDHWADSNPRRSSRLAEQPPVDYSQNGAGTAHGNTAVENKTLKEFYDLEMADADVSDSMKGSQVNITALLVASVKFLMNALPEPKGFEHAMTFPE